MYSKYCTDVFVVMLDILNSIDPSKYAVVFDIDDTILFNKHDTACYGELNGPIHHVFKIIETYGIPIFFVTARVYTTENEQMTRDQLSCLGLEYVDVFLRPSSFDTAADFAVFKSLCRKNIMEIYNKKILFNIGDQWTDLISNIYNKEFPLITKKYEGFYCIFKPLKEDYASWAVKLPSRYTL